jgi:hypothetical protein
MTHPPRRGSPSSDEASIEDRSRQIMDMASRASEGFVFRAKLIVSFSSEFATDTSSVRSTGSLESGISLSDDKGATLSSTSTD